MITFLEIWLKYAHIQNSTKTGPREEQYTDDRDHYHSFLFERPETDV